LKEPGIYSGGWPAVPAAEWRKTVARVRRLSSLEKRLAVLEGREADADTDKEES